MTSVSTPPCSLGSSPAAIPTAHLEAPPDEVLERICEAQWALGSKTGTSNGITLLDVHQHDAINHTLCGTVTLEGVEYGFVVDNGNWDGTVVREWGLADDVGGYEPPEPVIYTYAPRQPFSDMWAGMVHVYQAWTKEAWFKDKVRGYNYDRHFAPGGKTETHYRSWAASKGMRIVTKDEAAPYLATFNPDEHNARKTGFEAAILKALAATPSDTLAGHEAEGEVTPSKEPIHE